MSPEMKYSIDLPDDDIRAGRVCPYCGHPPMLADSPFGKRWECTPCEAYVGTHKGTEIPLGSLADPKLRERRTDVHQYFDQLWRRKMRRDGVWKSEARAAAYEWLAGEMGLEMIECHIGMMDLEECALAIKLCKPYYKENLYF